jgi:hypothetical protein
MASEPCAQRREQIGMLALGGLGAEEAAALRSHAGTCEGCREEIRALGAVAELLGHADAERVGEAPAQPPGTLSPRLAERLVQERRARRRRFAFGGVAAAAAAAAAAAVLVLPGGEPPVTRVAFDTGDPGIGLTASLTAQPWGTEVALAVRGIEEGTRCHVWLRGEAGRVPAGSFRYRYGRDSDEATLTSAVPASSVDAVEVRAGPQTFTAPVG